MARIAGRFARVEPRRRARSFLLGLLSGLPRDELLDDGRACRRGVSATGCSSCWLRRGGTPTRCVTTCAVTSWSTWAIRRGAGRGRDRRCEEGHPHGRGAAPVHRHRRADRERPGRGLPGLRRARRVTRSSTGTLYLPKSWTGDPGRCAAAGVPADVEFATKPALAAAMIARALDAGVPARWAAGDEVYGSRPGTARRAGGRGLGYVLAVASDHQITTGDRHPPGRGVGRAAAGTGLAAAVGRRRAPRRALLRLGADRHHRRRRCPRRPRAHWLLIRRNRPHRGTGLLPRLLAPQPTRCRWPRWSGWPEPDGGSRNPSRPARSSPPWTSTRSAAGPPGTAGPSWRCSPTPSWPS